MTVGNRMKSFRQRHKMTQTRLGEYLGVCKHSVIKYEAGKKCPEFRAMLFRKLERYVDENKAVPTIEGWKE